MPVYIYKHDWCGFEQQIFLKIDKENVTIPCYRCGRAVTARQQRDKSIKVGEADGQVGILRHDKQNKNRRYRED